MDRREQNSTQSQQSFEDNRDQKSENRSQATKIPQGMARFYSSTTNKTEDIGVSLTSRKNINQHVILDADWADGFKSSYIFWESGIVEILSKDGEGKIDNTPGTWTQNDESTVITSKTGSITIFPGLVPIAN